jgi:type II restriction enzyme
MNLDTYMILFMPHYTKFLEPAGQHFVEELVYRFLLTRGDTLGGSMRNVGGFLAQCKLSRAIIACLSLSGQPVYVQSGKSQEWVSMPSDDAGIELTLRGLSWSVASSQRTLKLNLTVPLVAKNVDLCLFDCPAIEFSNSIVNDPSKYVALGELKGGIDPAGADEHWKTAGTALARIREAFSKLSLNPHLFYVGGAIEAAMAEEIWERLTSGWLENAANLTNEDQISSIAQWVCAI